MSPLLPPQEPERLPASLALETERLRLRRFQLEDSTRVRELADHHEVAATTLNLPHPYTLADAESFVRGARSAWAEGASAVFAVVTKDAGTLIGSMGLTLLPSCDRAELGYWFGPAYWGRGFATEAARRVIQFGFENLGLNRVYAISFSNNPASERILQKLGMTHEGTMRQHYKRFGSYYDGRFYSLLRDEWQAES